MKRYAVTVATLWALALFPAQARTPPPVHEQDFKEILQRYYFVADFEVKHAERHVSDKLFWRYQYKLPEVSFPIYHDAEDLEKELPLTQGEGRAFFHLNSGRAAYLERDFELARSTWLSGRARYGTEYDYHRRNDYFIALAFLQLANEAAAQHPEGAKGDLPRATYANAATFLSSAFHLKEAVTDNALDEVTLKQLYNLAAIYFNYQRYAGAYGAATRALDFARRTGKMDYRSELNIILAESHIKNRSYLEAVQLFDDTLRQNPTRQGAASIFTRVGDIYFDLNNYELAEMNYALANRISRNLDQIMPEQFILRGETLFWLGKFSQAQQMLDYGLRMANTARAYRTISNDYEAFARLRIADSYLAREDFDAARLAYFDISHNYRNSEAGRIARIRHACLELPQFDGNNLSHARQLLEVAKKDDIPPQAREIAWACHVASFAERERTTAMVERVRQFHKNYPHSRFLEELVNPVREVQASKIEQYFSSGDLQGAVKFFELNRERLFSDKNLNDSLKRRLFLAYLDISQLEKSQEFWPWFKNERDSDLNLIRQALYFTELYQQNSDPRWKQKLTTLAESLRERNWEQRRSTTSRHYLQRIQIADQEYINLPWIYNLTRHWSLGDTEIRCNAFHPMMRRIKLQGDTLTGLQEKVAKDLNHEIDDLLPRILRSEEGCALNLLAMESASLKDNPKELSERYTKRGNWPMNRELARFFWEAAEGARKVRQHDTARQLWRIIAERAPTGSAESEFAKSRLEERKTEFEQLWQR